MITSATQLGFKCTEKPHACVIEYVKEFEVGVDEKGEGKKVIPTIE